MCGRYVSAASTRELIDEFEIGHVVGGELEPSWNVAPTQRVRIVAERFAASHDAVPGGARFEIPGLGHDAGRDNAGGDHAAPGGGDGDRVALGGAAADDVDVERQLRVVRWGLVPHWAKDRKIGTRMINARAETVCEKRSFKVAAARRRCLVPADGYYEWMRHGTQKTPMYLQDPAGQLLAMAGLYETWRDPSLPDDHPEHLLWTMTVITRSAPEALGHIHHRCPVVVPEDMRAAWLDCADSDAGDRDAEVADALLAAMPPPALQPREVGRAVGNVRNNSPELIDPAGGGAGGAEDAGEGAGGAEDAGTLF